MVRYDRKAIMKRAWEIKSLEKMYVFGECLKMAWKEAKSTKKEEYEYKHLDSLAYDAVWLNIQYYLENGIDRKPYAHNGVSYISLSPENYDFMMRKFAFEKDNIKKSLHMYGSDSIVYKNELREFELFEKTISVMKKEID